MRLVTFRDEAGTRLGVLREHTVLDLSRACRVAGQMPQGDLYNMLALIDAGTPGLDNVRRIVESATSASELPLDAVELLAPIPRPRKNIFCLGRNYAEHAAELYRALGQEMKLPEYPNVFTKAVTSITGPTADIPYDASVTQQLDWEVELAAVIGTAGRHIAKEDALGHVFGYTVLNDVTARDLQHQAGVQWFQGKSLDACSPVGPCIVTSDELPDPQRLRLRLYVNGDLKQDDTTDHMLFDVATIIATLSRVLTLEPGDIIATGTPSGVGFGRTPQQFLHPGDLMRSEIEGIGALSNRIVEVRR
jgi:2-keto-4-pentenoate hydratase/2-oxohepta-3-ene-1,7-dioic acid hydratase in catechol pathway